MTGSGADAVAAGDVGAGDHRHTASRTANSAQRRRSRSATSASARTTYNYQVANTGTTGPAIRGALRDHRQRRQHQRLRASRGQWRDGEQLRSGRGGRQQRQPRAVTFTVSSPPALLAPLSRPGRACREQLRQPVGEQTLEHRAGERRRGLQRRGRLGHADADRRSRNQSASARYRYAASHSRSRNTAPTANAFSEDLNAAFAVRRPARRARTRQRSRTSRRPAAANSGGDERVGVEHRRPRAPE